MSLMVTDPRKEYNPFMCKTLRPSLMLAWLCVLAGVLSAPRGSAAPPPSGTDFFVSAGFDDQSNTIEEYTADGRHVQTILVPANSGSYSQNGTEYLRGIAATDAGEIVGFNGTFSPELTTLHPHPRTFTSRTAPGWKISNNGSSGSVAAFQGYSFVITESFGSGDPPSAIIRFNPDGTSQEFAAAAAFDTAYINLTVGLDGRLYALHTDNANRTAPYYADVFDPISLQKLRTVHLQVPAVNGSSSADLRNLAVDSQGSLYVIDLYNEVYHFDVNGALLQSASHGQGGYTDDIKIDPSSGRLLISIGTYGAKILQTDASLSSFRTLVQLDPNKFEECFITFSNAKLATALLPATHLLWNNVDGRVMLWDIDGTGNFTLNGFGPYTDGAPQNVWHATAVATGADGLSHILWNNTDGRVMLWTVDDSGNFTYAGYGPYTDTSVNNAPGNVWHATAVSVGPDNVTHLLWNNTDHRVMLWNVAPDFTFTLAGYGPYTDTSVSNDPGNLWSATALATGPDNVSRIAWNNADGRVMLWDVNADYSFTLAGYGPYTDGAAQNKWSATGVSVGPDNLTHLLWSNTDRRAMFWNVDNSFSFAVAAGYGPYTDNGFGNLWTAAALATGPDGLSRILWDNTDHRVMLWDVDSAGDFGSEGNFGVSYYGPYTDTSVSPDPGNLWSATAVSAGP